ncbi:MAG TPA: PH domain-containing protein [Anaerovoracaceae bacterium]|nr:PH domain-containing protein [Anaerovoracaceae bacterium]
MDYEILDKKAITSWRIGRAISLAVMIILYVVLIIVIINADDVAEWVGYLAIGGCGAFVLYKIVGLIIYPIIEYKQWKYCVTEDKVEIVHGIFFVTKTIIPIIRIQNISVAQGPINRKLGLYKVEMSLASGSFAIEGLTKDVADAISENLKARLYTRIAEKGVL